MTALDDLPNVDSFIGIDLKTGSFIIAAICIVHPLKYGCTIFMPISYMIVTIWILVALFMAASIALLVGLTKDDHIICAIWIWYAVIFVALMMMMMILLALVFTSRKQKNKVFVVILGMIWYIVTLYFILVVNSHRKQLVKASDIIEKLDEKTEVEENSDSETEYLMTPVKTIVENLTCGHVADDISL